MKKNISFLFLICCFLSVRAQEGHKLNADIDLSLGLHYFDSEIHNPFVGGVSLGYEYDINMLFGIEAGIRVGGFSQKFGYNDSPNIGQNGLKSSIGEGGNSETLYKGMYWGPYIAPKIYLPIGYDDKKDRMRLIFIENRLSFTNISLNLDKVTNMSGSIRKNSLIYEIRAGYQFPIDERWGMSCWLGYNTFDFSRVKPDAIKHKNSTPFQIGIGFNYILKQ